MELLYVSIFIFSDFFVFFFVKMFMNDGKVKFDNMFFFYNSASFNRRS